MWSISFVVARLKFAGWSVEISMGVQVNNAGLSGVIVGLSLSQSVRVEVMLR